jgi:hypothetical protein
MQEERCAEDTGQDHLVLTGGLHTLIYIEISRRSASEPDMAHLPDIFRGLTSSTQTGQNVSAELCIGMLI